MKLVFSYKRTGRTESTDVDVLEGVPSDGKIDGYEIDIFTSMSKAVIMAHALFTEPCFRADDDATQMMQRQYDANGGVPKIPFNPGAKTFRGIPIQVME